MRIFLSILMTGLLTASCREYPKIFDMALSAQEANDLTVIFQGCREMTNGYLFCRLREGTRPRDVPMAILLPRVECKRDSCAVVQFFMPDGSLGHSQSAPKKQNRILFSLEELLGHNEPLTLEHEAELQAAVQIWFMDRRGGLEYRMRADGLIRLWIVDAEHIRLSCNDPQTGWFEDHNGCKAEYSTGFRTALCGGCN